MNKKILTAFILVLCMCSMLTLSSCNIILDFIFGPEQPIEPPDTHQHTMQEQTLSGEFCTEQENVKYYKCTDCGKCYLNEDGTNEVDEATLSLGHLYALKHDDNEHYRQCALCGTEQEGSRARHASDRYQYNANEHYRECNVCQFVFDRGEHDANLSCDVCGRKADYKAICNGRYGYNQLGTLNRGNYMQALYNEIDKKVNAVHDDESNVKYVTIGKDNNNQEVKDYAVEIDCSSCYVYADEAFMTVATYRNDNPLYYWLGKTVSLSEKGKVNKDDVAYVDKLYLCVWEDYATGAKRAEQNEKIYTGIDKYMSYASAESSAYNIAFALHDEIIANVNYAYQTNGQAQDEHWAHSIVGVFDRGSAVCEGYAKSFQLLLNACNVDNVYVVGQSHNEGHAWNMVKLDNGGWYLYDLTWDDQPDLPRGVMYDYLCRTEDEFDDHVAGPVNADKKLDYLYDLPKAATEPYASDDLEYDETFESNGFTYRLVGYDRLTLIGCVNNGEVIVPKAATYNERDYTVRELADTALLMSQQGSLVELICGATSLTIPSTVDLIYNKSFCNCKTLTRVAFADTDGWQRFAMTGKTPVYEQLSADKLSVDTAACALLKELQRTGSASGYCYIWVK